MTITIEAILECPNLPSLPAVAMRVLELTRDDRVRLNEIADCVQADQALTGKILKTVNSSYYGLTKPCPTIGRAIGYLGLNTVKSLVLGFSLVDTVGKDGDFDFVSYWRRGMYGGAGARAIADRTHLVDPDEAFTIALLQDVGMIALWRAAPDEYLTVRKKGTDDHDALCEVEREVFGFDHAEVSAGLIEKWRLPESFAEAVRLHHNLTAESVSHQAITRIVVLANVGAGALDPNPVPEKAARFLALADQWFALTQTEAKELLARIAEDGKQLSSIFKVATGVKPEVGALMSQASEQMVAHQIQQQQEQERLREENEQLERKTVTDALTGCFNRAFFDMTLAEKFNAARRSGGRVAVLFSDADRFKSVNDTHGHQIGDAVLVELASRMRDVVSSRGVVCRYGGEEFAVIVPDVGVHAAARIGEELRAAIEAQPFDMRDQPGELGDLPVTVSVGCAAYEPDTSEVLRNPEILLKAADKAVYAAKEGGRNCVRVFYPKSRPVNESA